MFPSAVPPSHRLLSTPAGGTAGRTQAHPSLSLHSMARPRSPRDHPVSDPVCENCQRLHQQKPGGGAHGSALQVGATGGKGGWRGCGRRCQEEATAMRRAHDHGVSPSQPGCLPSASGSCSPLLLTSFFFTASPFPFSSPPTLFSPSLSSCSFSYRMSYRILK